MRLGQELFKNRVDASKRPPLGCHFCVFCCLLNSIHWWGDWNCCHRFWTFYRSWRASHIFDSFWRPVCPFTVMKPVWLWPEGFPSGIHRRLVFERFMFAWQFWHNDPRVSSSSQDGRRKTSFLGCCRVFGKAMFQILLGFAPSAIP